MVQRKKEEEVKVAIGRWLTRNGLEVYDEAESKRRPSWSGVFHVENVDKKRKPDLVIGCRMIGESESEV